MKRFVIPALMVLAIVLAYLWHTGRLGTASEKDANGFPPEMVEKAKQNILNQKKLRELDPAFFASVSAAMFKEDPMGINYKTNTDEYDPETTMVIPRLKDCASADDVATALHGIFIENFDKGSAGDRGRYVGLGKEIWALWQARGHLTPHS